MGRMLYQVLRFSKPRYGRYSRMFSRVWKVEIIPLCSIYQGSSVVIMIIRIVMMK